VIRIEVLAMFLVQSVGVASEPRTTDIFNIRLESGTSTSGSTRYAMNCNPPLNWKSGETYSDFSSWRYPAATFPSSGITADVSTSCSSPIGYPPPSSLFSTAEANIVASYSRYSGLSIRFSMTARADFHSSAAYYDGTGRAVSALRAEFNLDGSVPWRYRLSVGPGGTTTTAVTQFDKPYLTQIDGNLLSSATYVAVGEDTLYDYYATGRNATIQAPFSKDGFVASKTDGSTLIRLSQSSDVKVRQLLDRTPFNNTRLSVCSGQQSSYNTSGGSDGILDVYPLRPLSCFAVGVNWPTTGPQEFDGPKAVDLFLGAMRLLPSFKMAMPISIDPSRSGRLNRTDVLDAWTEFEGQIQRNESVVIYLVGHMAKEKNGNRMPTCLQSTLGASAPETCVEQYSGPNFLVVGLDHTDDSSHHLADTDVRMMIEKLSQKNCSVLVVLDGCYSGGFEETLQGIPGVAMLAAADGRSLSGYKLQNGLPFMTSLFWKAIVVEKKYFLDDISKYISGSVLSEFENQPIGVGRAYINGETMVYRPSRPKVFVSNHSGDVFGDPAIAGRSSWDCICDVTGDAVVDDGDFLVFVFQYDVLVCESAEMRMTCVCDYDQDGFVDDNDFMLFANAYDVVVCDPAS
jgi:hypothetical protein